MGNHQACTKLTGLPSSGDGVSDPVKVGLKFQQVTVLAPGADGSNYKFRLEFSLKPDANPAVSADWMSWSAFSGLNPSADSASFDSVSFPVYWLRVRITAYSTGNPSTDPIWLAMAGP